MMKKRLLSLLLAFVLFTGLLPVDTLAADGATEISNQAGLAAISGSGNDSEAGLFASLGDGAGKTETNQSNIVPGSLTTVTNSYYLIGGTADSSLDWVEISTVEQLQALTRPGADLSQNYRLTGDLDLQGMDFPGIGSVDAPFTGVFDGQGHTVSHVRMDGTDNVGFFNVLLGATVKNLNLKDVDISGQTNVGAIAGASLAALNKDNTGKNAASLVGSCAVSGGTLSGRSNTGGLVGLNASDSDSDAGLSTSSSVDKCSAAVTVRGSADKIGGLVGSNQGVITKSAATGAVEAETAAMVGGLAGDNGGSIYESHAEGAVSGSNAVGGFAGSSGGSVTRCYSLGNVTGQSNLGGFAGTLHAADTVVGAGSVSAGGDYVGGLAGSLSGQLVGAANQINVKRAYGNCSGGVSVIGNTSRYTGDGNAAALSQMRLETMRQVSDALYTLFGVNLGTSAALEAEMENYADSLFVPNTARPGDVLQLLKAGKNPAPGVNVSYAVDSELLAGGSSLILAGSNTGESQKIEVILVLTDTEGGIARKAVTVVLQGAAVDRDALMDAIAAGYTGSGDSWTVMDMALYSGLEGKTLATTGEARQNALNLMISAAAGDASVSDRARMEIVLRAMGVDSTKLYTVNGNHALNNASRLSAMELDAGGYYGAPWILLADLQGNLKLSQSQTDQLIALLKNNMGDGLFGYEYDGIHYDDPDTACTALAALARFESAQAQEIKAGVLNALPGAMDQSGSLGNANADAMAIIGLIAVGRDPAEMKSVSGASLVDGLMSHVNEQRNGFTYPNWQTGVPETNALATEQGFRALVALSMFQGQPVNLYDFSTRSVQPGRATGTGETVRPSDPVGSGEIQVSFTLKTDSETWIPKRTLRLREGSTVYHAFVKALAEAGISAQGAESGYVRSITKGGVTLSEFDRGENSGWLYQINGSNPQVGLTSYVLSDNDEILWYYSADWTREPGAGSWPGGGSADAAKPKEEKSAVELKPAATVDKSGAASAVVTEKELNGAIAQAKTGKTDRILITPAVKGNAVKVSVELPKTSLDAIAKQTSAALTVKTDLAVLTVPAAGLSGLAKGEGKTVSISAGAIKDTGNLKIEIAVDGRAVEKIDGGIVVAIPAKRDPGNVLVLVKADGTEEVVKKSTVQGAAVSALLNGSAMVKVVNRAKPFADTANHWAKEAIDFASSHELFRGTGESTFSPDDAMSRAMLATVLYRLEGAAANGGSPFADVVDDRWYTDAVVWANAQNIVSGTGNGFAPHRDVTRQELVTMLYRYAKSVGLDTGKAAKLDSYTDSGDVAGWATDAMSWAVGNGLVSGRTSTELAPAGTATRAEVAAVIQRLVALMVQ